MYEKRPVYNGYEERYVTGAELKDLFKEQYLSGGRHHSVVLGISITEYLYLLRIDDSKSYRIFINDFFCRVMKGDTDGLVTFFSHVPVDNIKISINPEEVHLEMECADCGAPMKFKEGKFGAFLGCSKYPNCKHTRNIPIIGNYKKST